MSTVPDWISLTEKAKRADAQCRVQHRQQQQYLNETPPQHTEAMKAASGVRRHVKELSQAIQLMRTSIDYGKCVAKAPDTRTCTLFVQKCCASETLP